jgi:uncharacterized protein
MAMNLTRTDKETLREIKQQLVKELGNDLDSLILYGSLARRDLHSESDIDILMILEDKNLEDKAFGKIYDIDLKNSTYTTLFTATTQEIEQYLRSGSPFLEEIFKEGEILYDNGTWEKIRGNLTRAKN